MADSKRLLGIITDATVGTDMTAGHLGIAVNLGSFETLNLDPARRHHALPDDIGRFGLCTPTIKSL